MSRGQGHTVTEERLCIPVRVSAVPQRKNHFHINEKRVYHNWLLSPAGFTQVRIVEMNAYARRARERIIGSFSVGVCAAVNSGIMPICTIVPEAFDALPLRPAKAAWHAARVGGWAATGRTARHGRRKESNRFRRLTKLSVCVT